MILNMSGAPIRDEAGRIEHAVLIYRDVTERRRLEQRTAEALRALLASEQALRETNRHMEEFISIICHELKTPLTVMRCSVQLAERKVKRLVAVDALLPDEMRRFASVQALLERTKNQISIQ